MILGVSLISMVLCSGSGARWPRVTRLSEKAGPAIS